MGIAGVKNKNASCVTGEEIAADATGMMRMGYMHGYLAGVAFLICFTLFELTLTSKFPRPLRPLSTSVRAGVVDVDVDVDVCVSVCASNTHTHTHFIFYFFD